MGCVNCKQSVIVKPIFATPCITANTNNINPCDFVRDSFFTIQLVIDNSTTTSFIDAVYIIKNDDAIKSIDSFPQTVVFTDGAATDHTLNHVSDGMYVVGSGGATDHIEITTLNIGTWVLDVNGLTFTLPTDTSCTQDIDFSMEITLQVVSIPIQAYADSIIVNQGDTGVVSILDNDVFNGASSSISIAIHVQPLHGNVSIVGEDIHYTPDTGYCGKDSFAYEITDSFSQTSTAIVTTGTPCPDCPTSYAGIFTGSTPLWMQSGQNTVFDSIIVSYTSLVSGLTAYGSSYFQDSTGNVVAFTTYNAVLDKWESASPVIYTGGIWTHTIEDAVFTLAGTTTSCTLTTIESNFTLDACQFFTGPQLSSVIENVILSESSTGVLSFDFDFLYLVDDGNTFEYSKDGGTTWLSPSAGTNTLAYSSLEWSQNGFQLRVNKALNGVTCTYQYNITSDDYTDVRGTIPIAFIDWYKVTGLRDVIADATVSQSFGPPIVEYAWTFQSSYPGQTSPIQTIVLQGAAGDAIPINTLFTFLYSESGNSFAATIGITGTYDKPRFVRPSNPVNNITLNATLVVTDTNGSSNQFPDQYFWTYSIGL